MKQYLYLAIVVIVILLAIYIFIDSTNYRITKYELESDIINKDIHFVFISDLHECSYNKDNSAVISDIKKLEPEFIILAGDIFTSTKSKRHSFDKTINFVKELSSICPVYYGLGNHEQRMKERPEEYGDKYEYIYNNLKNAGICILDNESIDIEGNISITGLSIEMPYYRKLILRQMPNDYISTILKGGDKNKNDSNKYSILIAHNPEYFDNYTDYGSDLVLSGHNHGGIACLPLLGGVLAPSYKIFPKYDFGVFKSKNTTMILSRGMGGHTIPLRFNNRAELIDVKIKRK